jgi:hypothetical protein
MFERYTERARRVLFFARYEASQLGSVSIETEHLLLGLLREGKGLTSRLFAGAHLSLADLRQEIESRTVARAKISTSVEIPFSAETKRVLELAADEADRLLHNYIGTEHLLLGLFREERSLAASILTGRGMRLESVRADLKQPGGDSPWLAVVAAAQHLENSGVVPSEAVHITLHITERAADHTEWVMSMGSRHWVMLGAPLRLLMAHAYHVDPSSLLVPAHLDEGSRYDLVLLLPHEESYTRMAVRVQRALQGHFGVSLDEKSGAEPDR